MSALLRSSLEAFSVRPLTDEAGNNVRRRNPLQIAPPSSARSATRHGFPRSNKNDMLAKAQAICVSLVLRA